MITTHMCKKLLSSVLLCVATMALATHTAAQEGESTSEESDSDGETQAIRDEIVIYGTRIANDLATIPNSVTVLDTEDIEEQRAFTSDPLQLLANKIPGFGVASPGTISSFDQTLRGRRAAVFIDGVPTTTPLRDGARDLRVISTNALDRVEVIRGATAIYGLGGAGGVVNYVTKTPPANLDGLEFLTSLRSGISLTNPTGSHVGGLEQEVSGRYDAFSFTLNGTLEQYSSLYDADGDRLPPNPGTQGGLADTFAYNLFGKATYDVSDTQFLQFTVNQYRLEQDTPFRAGNGVFGSVKTPALDGPLEDEKDQYSENFIIYGRYANADLFGSRMNITAYYGENRNRFRLIEGVFVDPALMLGLDGDQTQIFSDKRGVRLDIVTPAPAFQNTNIIWGIDLGEDETFSTLANQDVLLVPKMEQTSVAPFVQLEVDLVERLKVRGGIRYEDISLDVETFTTAFILPGLEGGDVVTGGTLDYSKAVFNIGAVFDVTSNLNVFASYSQGFSVADIGRVLLFGGFPTVEAFQAEAQVIDSYEAGIRGAYETFDFSVSAYENKSDLGSTFNTVTFQLLRQKERVRGVEVTANWDIVERTRIGATYSYSDGDTDTDDDGELDSPLDTTRIGPEKLTGYVEWAPKSDWQFRLQGLHSGSQDRFPGAAPAFGRAPIESYFILDVSASIPAGSGRLTVGVQNLLNEDYFLPSGLRMALPTTYVKGPGASVTIGYSVRY